jgi:starvation-inducible outer membrane lipoprotein
MTPRAILAAGSAAIALLLTGCSMPQQAMPGSSHAMSASPTAMMTDAMSAQGSYVDSTGAKVMTWSGQPTADVLAALKG